MGSTVTISTPNGPTSHEPGAAWFDAEGGRYRQNLLDTPENACADDDAMPRSDPSQTHRNRTGGID
jgi:hypothetical protein